MKLKDWLQKKQMTQMDLLNMFIDNGLPITQGAVNKWVNEQRIPRKSEMKLIYQITKKKVNANDFYDLTC